VNAIVAQKAKHFQKEEFIEAIDLLSLKNHIVAGNFLKELASHKQNIVNRTCSKTCHS